MGRWSVWKSSFCVREDKRWHGTVTQGPNWALSTTAFVLNSNPNSIMQYFSWKTSCIVTTWDICGQLYAPSVLTSRKDLFVKLNRRFCVSQLRYAHWRRYKSLPHQKCSHCFWEVHPVTWAQYRLRCPRLAWRDREITNRNVIIRLLLAYLTVLSVAWIMQCRVMDNQWILCWEEFLRKRSWFGLFCLSTERTIALGYRDVGKAGLLPT
jgi:hypothetical protein